MDDLGRDAREALRRYHAGAALDPTAHARVWQRIEQSMERDEAAPARRGSGRFIIVPILVGLAAGILAICDVRGRLEESRRVDAAVYQAAPGSVETLRPRAPAAPASVVHEPAPPPARPSRRIGAPPVTSPGDRGLAAEVAYMRQARAAIDAGDPGAALRALDEHAREFAAGQMLEDRLRLRIEATCALGREEQARAQADEFLRDHPGSPHAARVRELCRDDLP
jgi:hypothetical protein